MYKQFKELLLANCEKPMSEQKSMLGKALKDWKGDCKQIDDITILGFKI